MPIWNPSDLAAFAERALVRTRALRQVPTSYKAQALRELARRLELEGHLRQVLAELARATDRAREANNLLQAAGLQGGRDV